MNTIPISMWKISIVITSWRFRVKFRDAYQQQCPFNTLSYLCDQHAMDTSSSVPAGASGQAFDIDTIF